MNLIELARTIVFCILIFVLVYSVQLRMRAEKPDPKKPEAKKGSDNNARKIGRLIDVGIIEYHGKLYTAVEAHREGIGLPYDEPKKDEKKPEPRKGWLRSR